MNNHPHRNNSDFQLRHFIAGGCHTADGAWNVLYEQMLDVQIKLEHTKAQALRREARRLDLEQSLKSSELTPSDMLRVKADLMDWQSAEGLNELAIAGAERELATIKSLMAELEPHRKYGHLPLLEATEAAQRDEWREEFKSRIETYLISQGTIPEDQLRAMRNHPDFMTDLVTHIRRVSAMLENSADRLSLLNRHEPLFLEHKSEK